ncbi:MAG: hypothetical protein IJ641_07405 [Lachnospiraceae bacterium]|nr:hypothetical protein [Lachnospiraceae bacterium]
MVIRTDSSLYSEYHKAMAEKARKYSPFSNMPGMQEEQESESAKKAKKMRAMLRELMNPTEDPRNPNAASSKNKNAFDELAGNPNDDEEEKELQKISKYSYKEVANKIQRAKTSVSAAQAVIAAKRKVVEVKRKISNGDGDPEELQLALTHAKRMEMAARKKKHNLELEELVEHTRKRDENTDRMEEAASDMKEALVQMSEEEITKQEDAVFEERQDMTREAEELFEERSSESSDQMLADMNAMIAEYGEELLEELEQQMEQLENMEMVDPHMSEEDLKELKQKHRAAESKAIVKADMDYLKGMIKHMQEKGSTMQGFSGTSGSISAVPVPAGLIFTAATGAEFTAPPSEGAAPSVDIAI